VAARTDAPVLLIGETGTGKELAAHFIHRYSRCRDKPFVALDCTVVTEALFESEVFGHERGAFTGSVGAKKGLFEAADGGTLFVDEIGEATPAMQAKLLRVLETGQFRRLGGNKTLHVNARVVCATNRDLWEEVKAGRFREDLYYRIACFRVRIPPLRERLDDIPVLAESLLQRLSETANRSFRLTREALEYLAQHDFPGNVRELRNMLQVAVAHSTHSPSGMITRERLEGVAHNRPPATLGSAPRGPTPAPSSVADATTSSVAAWAYGAVAPSPQRGGMWMGPPGPSSAHTPSLHDLEARHIADLLKRFEGNRRRVAESLGISERTLYRKLSRYNLKDLQE
jgi:DNA-binding NtrC family response regulator